MRAKVYVRRQFMDGINYIVKIDEPDMTIRFLYWGGLDLSVQKIWVHGYKSWTRKSRTNTGRYELPREIYSALEPQINLALDKVEESMQEASRQRFKFGKQYPIEDKEGFEWKIDRDRFWKRQ